MRIGLQHYDEDGEDAVDMRDFVFFLGSYKIYAFYYYDGVDLLIQDTKKGRGTELARVDVPDAPLHDNKDKQSSVFDL